MQQSRKQIEVLLNNATVTFTNPYIDALKTIVCNLHPGCTNDFIFSLPAGKTTNKSPAFVLSNLDESNARVSFAQPRLPKEDLTFVNVSPEAFQAFCPPRDDKASWFAHYGMSYETAIDQVLDSWRNTLAKADNRDKYACEAARWLGVKFVSEAEASVHAGSESESKQTYHSSEEEEAEEEEEEEEEASSGSNGEEGEEVGSRESSSSSSSSESSSEEGESSGYDSDATRVSQ